MKYEAYQAYSDMMLPMRLFTQTAVAASTHPWISGYPGIRTLTAAWEAWEVLSSAGITHTRPGFRLTSVRVGEGNQSREVAIHEEAMHVAPFGTLLHFKKEGIAGQPRVLI